MEIDKKNKKITSIREYYGLRQNEFAKKLNVSSSLISLIELGKTVVRPAMINDICKAFRVDKDYFSDIIAVNKLQNYIRSGNSNIVYDNISTGQRLAQIRRDHNLTQQELAEHISVTQTTISDIESGKKKLTEKQAVKIADVYDFGVDYIMYGDLNHKDYPVNNKLISWLWDHEDVRKELWKKMSVDNNKEI